MQLIEFPVSLVMKAWHVILTSLGMDAVSSWPVTIILLVLTVRLILLPFAYRALKSTRMLINLRPALASLDKEYAGVKDRDALREKMRRRKEVQHNGGYRMRDGCVPMLIQIPVFLGLYRILLTVSRPPDLETGAHRSIGALNSTDVGQFLQAEVFGVPLPAYSVMTEERFAFLGTSSSEVFRVALPLCLTAAVITTGNMIYSVKRNWTTLDEESAFARGMFKFLVLLVPFSLGFPLVFGLAGPAPVAIMCYWVMNNLWTLVQNVGLQVMMDRKVPYSEEFLVHRKEARVRRRERRRTPSAVDVTTGTTGTVGTVGTISTVNAPRDVPEVAESPPAASTAAVGRHRLERAGQPDRLVIDDRPVPEATMVDTSAATPPQSTSGVESEARSGPGDRTGSSGGRHRRDSEGRHRL